jgi:hypothetical protein
VLAYPVLYWAALARSLPVVGVRMREYFAAVRGPALAALAMYAAVFGLRHVLEGLALPPAWILLVLVLAGVVLYTAVALSLMRETCIDFITLLGSEEIALRIAAFDPLSPFKAALPRPFKEKVKERTRQWYLDRALRTLVSLPAGAPVERSLLQELHYGWGNSGWSVDVEFLRTLCNLARSATGPVLECGSGLTTVLLGALGRRQGLRVWSLEHDPAWRARVQQVASRHGLDNVTVCDAPLRPFRDYTWYDVSQLELPRDFALVICDGPPDATPGGRYGLLPVMRGRFAPECVILVDDIQREHERTMLERWKAESTIRVDSAGATFAVCRL